MALCRQAIRKSSRAWVLAFLVAYSTSCSDSAESPAPSAPSTPSAPSVASVTVTLVAVTPGHQATAVAAFSDGSSREVTSSAQWGSSNANVASVSADGRVTPLAPGSTEIRATYESVTGSAPLAVTQVPSPSPGPGPSPPPPSPPPPSPRPSPSSYRFTGTILDGLDSEPIKSVYVGIVSEDQEISTWIWTDSHGGYDISGSSTSATVDVTVTARFDGYATQSVKRVASPGQSKVDFRLTPLPFTLSGHVRDGQDGNLPKCAPTLVTVINGPNAGRSVEVPRTAADGSYQLPNMQPGTVTIRATAPGYYIRETTARLRGSISCSPLCVSLNTLDFVLPR
jgi:hypothetical protein